LKQKSPDSVVETDNFASDTILIDYRGYYFSETPKIPIISAAVPASSYLANKSKVFNENIQILYSTLGTTDDLDMIVGTGKLDTVYTGVAQQFNLYDHYKMKEKGDAALRKASSILKNNAMVMKSEYGELKVKVWDTDKNLAPQLANAIMDVLQAIHTNLQGIGIEATLKSLIQAKEKLIKQTDSTSLSADQKVANLFWKILSHPLLLLLILLIVWMLITVIFSTHPLISVKFLLAKTWYVGAFVLAPLLLFGQKKAIIIAARSLVAAMLNVAAVALIRHSEQGFSFATINDAVYPFFRNHVNYSAMLVCIIPVLFAFFIRAKTGNHKLTAGLFIVIVLAALFFSYSRGVWLALIVG
jgi:hypothetical protein